MNETAATVSKPAWQETHANIRTDAYVLLAALLTDAPTEQLIAIMQKLEWDEGIPEKLQHTLASLIERSNSDSLAVIADEFQRLFVGLGSGEIVPYASWYREKMIQSRPLAAIRSDIGRLGIIRRSETFESEDHAGALCEIMALLSNPKNEISDSEQAAFFENHIAPWMPDFFRDLQTVDNAEFYRSVGEFGLCFLDEESKYLQSAD